MTEYFKPEDSVILVVDDSMQNLKLLGNMLKDWNYQIALAKNGREALEIAPKIIPSLILLDIMMPEMDGYQVCNELKKDSKTKDIPVIFLTAKTSNEDIIKGFKAGGVDYITKPFNQDELMMRIQTHLELKAAHDKIQTQAEELRESNATKDKMFSVISHDLRAPLGGIKSMMDIIFEDRANNKEISDKSLQSLKTAADQTYNLLENLLYWSRQQRKKLNFDPELINLYDLVEENLELMNSLANNKNIEIKNELPTELTVFADNNMIKTIIRNLINNAIKFSNKGGKIRIHSEIKEETVFLSIEDNGIGIDEENLKKIQDKKQFFTTYGTGREKGSGLGLNLCFDFARRNNGDLTIKSIQGEGSIFILSLPSKK
ncbi:MAG: hybrid sensor histidine kinase/response regulator [Bacteroidota bacterium]